MAVATMVFLVLAATQGCLREQGLCPLLGSSGLDEYSDATQQFLFLFTDCTAGWDQTC